ncbi:MAG TPA: ABC transporter permease [Candidatus Avisuccinivibrio pullicola]|nr:ABC transporter permease [Candidatus Avisuccinivibrio pullicola]
MRMLKSLLLRLVSLSVTLLILSLTVFILSRLMPGDPLTAFYGDVADTFSDEELARARAYLNLDAPLFPQYLTWLSHTLQGDLGFSYRYHMPVAELLAPLIINTLLLGALSFVIIFALALLLALLCVRYEERLIDRAIRAAGTVTYLLPSFWVGLILILIFALTLKWLPASGAYAPGESHSLSSRLTHLVLPVTVMVLSHLWYFGALLRNRLADEVREPYVLNMRAAGKGRWAVLVTECLPAVLPTLFNVMAIAIPHVLSGTFVVEAVFNYPGVGAMAVESVRNHDYSLLLALILITSLAVVAAAQLSASAGGRLDPRLKRSARERCV